MGEAYHPDGYQDRDQKMPYFLTFQVVGWVDVFQGKYTGVLFLKT